MSEAVTTAPDLSKRQPMRTGYNVSTAPPAQPFTDLARDLPSGGWVGGDLNAAGDVVSGRARVSLLTGAYASGPGVYSVTYSASPSATVHFACYHADDPEGKDREVYDRSVAVKNPDGTETVSGHFGVSPAAPFVSCYLFVTDGGVPGADAAPVFALKHVRGPDWHPGDPEGWAPRYVAAHEGAACLRNVNVSGAIAGNLVNYSDLTEKGFTVAYRVKSVAALQGPAGSSAAWGVGPGAIPLLVTLDRPHSLVDGLSVGMTDDAGQPVNVPVSVDWCPAGSNGVDPATGKRYVTPLWGGRVFVDPAACGPDQVVVGVAGGLCSDALGWEPRGDASWRYSTALDDPSHPRADRPVTLTMGVAGVVLPADYAKLCALVKADCYWCLPGQSTLEATASVVADIARVLPKGLKLFLEFENEPWNNGTAVYHNMVAAGYKLHAAYKAGAFPYPMGPDKFTPQNAPEYAGNAYVYLAGKHHAAGLAAWTAAGRDAADFQSVLGSMDAIPDDTAALLGSARRFGYGVDWVMIGSYWQPQPMPAGTDFAALTDDQAMDWITASVETDGARQRVLAHLNYCRDRNPNPPGRPAPRLGVYEGGPSQLDLGGTPAQRERQSQRAYRHPKIRGAYLSRLEQAQHPDPSDPGRVGVEQFLHYQSFGTPYSEAGGGPKVNRYGALETFNQVPGLGLENLIAIDDPTKQTSPIAGALRDWNAAGTQGARAVTYADLDNASVSAHKAADDADANAVALRKAADDADAALKAAIGTGPPVTVSGGTVLLTVGADGKVARSPARSGTDAVPTPTPAH